MTNNGHVMLTKKYGGTKNMEENKVVANQEQQVLQEIQSNIQETVAEFDKAMNVLDFKSLSSDDLHKYEEAKQLEFTKEWLEDKRFFYEYDTFFIPFMSKHLAMVNRDVYRMFDLMSSKDKNIRIPKKYKDEFKKFKTMLSYHKKTIDSHNDNIIEYDFILNSIINAKDITTLPDKSKGLFKTLYHIYATGVAFGAKDSKLITSAYNENLLKYKNIDDADINYLIGNLVECVMDEYPANSTLGQLYKDAKNINIQATISTSLIIEYVFKNITIRDMIVTNKDIPINICDKFSSIIDVIVHDKYFIAKNEYGTKFLEDYLELMSDDNFKNAMRSSIETYLSKVDQSIITEKQRGVLGSIVKISNDAPGYIMSTIKPIQSLLTFRKSSLMNQAKTWQSLDENHIKLLNGYKIYKEGVKELAVSIYNHINAIRNDFEFSDDKNYNLVFVEYLTLNIIRNVSYSDIMKYKPYITLILITLFQFHGKRKEN